MYLIYGCLQVTSVVQDVTGQKGDILPLFCSDAESFAESLAYHSISHEAHWSISIGWVSVSVEAESD